MDRNRKNIPGNAQLCFIDQVRKQYQGLLTNKQGDAISSADRTKLNNILPGLFKDNGEIDESKLEEIKKYYKPSGDPKPGGDSSNDLAQQIVDLNNSLSKDNAKISTLNKTIDQQRQKIKQLEAQLEQNKQQTSQIEVLPKS